jgi:Fe-S cluster biogenesis protein NfuA
MDSPNHPSSVGHQSALRAGGRRYENGVAYMHMQGSCAGCPSSQLTLKQGIEHRLREIVPDLVEVVPV